MPVRNVVGFILCAAFFFAAQCPSYALKNNDFTKANASSNKKYSSEKSKLGERRSYLQEQGKVERLRFVTPDNADYLANQMAPKPDSALGDSMSRQRDYRSRQEYLDIPEYHKESDDWYKARTELHLDNIDRDLSKKYLGKIDTSKRDLYDQNYLRERYAEMLELSMQDINKFYFRESHSTEAGIPTQVAGGDLKDGDDASIFDFLSNEKKIDRPKVSLIGPRKNPPPDADSSENSKPVSEAAPSAAPLPPSGGVKLMPPVVKRSSESPSQQQQSGQKKRVTAIERLDPESVKNFQFMNLPENMRGETTIKVEVDDSGF